MEAEEAVPAEHNNCEITSNPGSQYLPLLLKSEGKAEDGAAAECSISWGSC